MGKLAATDENLLTQLHEVYRDCEEQKKRVVTDLKIRQKKFLLKEGEEADFDKMSALAAANNKTYDVINVLIKNKIELLKVQAGLIKGVGRPTKDEIEGMEKSEYENIKNATSLSEDDMEKIREIAKNTRYELNGE